MTQRRLMKVRGLPGLDSPRCDAISNNRINGVSIWGKVLTCLISSGYRVILCTVKGVQREVVTERGGIYLEREGNSKDRGFGQQSPPEGAVKR
jgi:hypothetical protein